MLKIFYPLSFLTLLASCSDYPQIPKDDKVQSELKKEREFVVGNFRDPKVKDTIFIELIDAKTAKYVPSKLDPDFQTNLDLLVKRDTKLQMVLCDQTVLLSDYEQVVGTSVLKNLGDLNGDGLDEIGFVWYAEDFSMLNTYYVYSFYKGKLTEAGHFGIHDDMLDDSEPFIKKDENGNLVCRSYDPIEEESTMYRDFKLF